METVNTTSLTFSCTSHHELCNIYNSIVYIPTNTASIIINLLHLLVLRNMHGLKELNYFWVLVNLTLGDIGMSVAGILIVNCEIWNSGNCFTIIVSYAVIGCAFQVRYWLLTLAVLDRYYAVCKPFKYATSKFINNVGKWAAVGWILNAMLTLTDAFLSCSRFCFDSLEEPFPELSLDVSKYLNITIILSAVLPAMVSKVLLIKISVELKRMKQRRNATVEDKETQSETRYIRNVFVMFYVSIIPNLVLVISFMIKIDTSGAVWLTSFALFTNLLYGIGNVVLYGVLHKAYVTTVKSICRLLCPVARISPQ